MTEFSPDRYAMLIKKEQKHFWFLARQTMVTHLIRHFCTEPIDMLADIGCGSGYNLSLLEPYAKHLIGIDRLINLSPHGKVSRPQTQFVSGDVQRLPLNNQSIDMVMSLDVLEHVDDIKMLKELHRILQPNALLFTTVPAIPWLWSDRDSLAGHQRRYTKSHLIKVLDQAGFQIKYINYYQFLLFPLVIISRLIGKNSTLQRREENPGRFSNYLLLKISTLENWLAKSGMKFPWGSSLVVVAQKR